MDIFYLINLAKYILGGIGVVGLIVLIAGAYRGNRELIQRGALTIITALVLFVCGYFVLKKSIQKAEYMIEEIYNNY